MLGHRITNLVGAIVVWALLGVACSSSTATPPQPAPPKTTLAVPEERSADVHHGNDDSGDDEPIDAGGDTPPSPPDTGEARRLDCAIKEPIKSADACNAAADCAPSSLCHARSCVATGNAPVRPPGGVSCTMNLVCRSIDVGRCDCVDGVCALVAR